jgi:hypothetical protein
LVAFDVAGAVPAGATITGVTLTLRDVQGQNGDQVVSLHHLDQDWGEGSSTGAAAADGDATWLYTFYNAVSPGDSSTWATPGGSFAALASASTLISNDLGAGQLFSWSSAGNPQMLADVQQWLAAPATNFGWIVVGNETVGQTAKRFNGGESATPPVLEIQYVIPEPGAVLLASLAGVAGPIRRRRFSR